jgi:tRNA(adenine34) deaminase
MRRLEMAILGTNDKTPGEAPDAREEEGSAASPSDEFFMQFALSEAVAAGNAGEVPIGAIVVKDGQIIGRGHNRPIGLCDPTAHAEIVAIREAAKTVGNYRLTGATLYVTIEPCAMCAGALVNARFGRVVFGAHDTRAGAIESVFAVCSSGSLNHKVEATSGVCAEEARALMKGFFRARRGSVADSAES